MSTSRSFLRLPSRLLVAALGLACAGAALASPVTVTSGYAEQYAFDGSAFGTGSSTSAAWGTRMLTTAVAGASSVIRSDWVDQGSGALLDFDVDQVRSGALYAHGLVGGNVVFTVGAANTRYQLYGLFAAAGAAGRVYADTWLQDAATGQVLFHDWSDSLATADESFLLGTAGDGDANNATEGSLSGTLLAGHRYVLSYTYLIHAISAADAGARVTGCLSLALGTTALDGQCGVAAENAAANAVPEPGSMGLAGLALAAAAAAARRRRR